MFNGDYKFAIPNNTKYFLSQFNGKNQETIRHLEHQNSKRKLTIEPPSNTANYKPSDHAFTSSLKRSKSNKGIELLEKVEENLRLIRKDIDKMNTISAQSEQINENYNQKEDNETTSFHINSLGHNANRINYQDTIKPLWLKKNHSMASIYSRNSTSINNRDNTPPYLIKMIKKYQPKYKQCSSNSLKNNCNLKKSIIVEYNNPISKTNNIDNINIKLANKVYSRLSKPKEIALTDINPKKRINNKTKNLTSASSQKSTWIKKTIKSEHKLSDEESNYEEEPDYSRDDNANDYNNKSQKMTLQPTREETDYYQNSNDQKLNNIDENKSHNYNRKFEVEHEDSDYEYILIKKKKNPSKQQLNPNSKMKQLNNCYATNISVKYAMNSFRNTEMNKKTNSNGNKACFRRSSQDTKTSNPQIKMQSEQKKVIKPNVPHFIKAFSNQYRNNNHYSKNTDETNGLLVNESYLHPHPPIPKKKNEYNLLLSNNKMKLNKNQYSNSGAMNNQQKNNAENFEHNYMKESSMKQYYFNHPDHHYYDEESDEIENRGYYSIYPNSNAQKF